MTLIEELRQMPVDKAAEFIFETAINSCMFCAQDHNKCSNTTKQICVDQITVRLLQEA